MGGPKLVLGYGTLGLIGALRDAAVADGAVLVDHDPLSRKTRSRLSPVSRDVQGRIQVEGWPVALSDRPADTIRRGIAEALL